MVRDRLSRRRFLESVGALALTTALPQTDAPAAGVGAAPAPRVRFGFTAPQNASYRDILGFWQDADVLGFDTAFVCDHFIHTSHLSTGVKLDDCRHH